MKKIILFFLTISALLIFNSCGKDHDYRDKWVGDYSFQRISSTHDDGNGTVAIQKQGNEQLLLKLRWESWGNYIDIERLVSVDEAGIIADTGKNIEGNFINRDSLVFTEMTIGHNAVVTDTYYCKKVKK